MSECTLHIPDDLFAKIQQLAAQQHISANQLLISVIKNNISIEKPTTYEQAMAAAFADMDEGLPFDGQPLVREAIYER